MVRIAVPVYQKLLKLASEKACTIADASLSLMKEPEAKEKIITKIKTITKKIPLEEIQLGTCSICKKPITWTLPRDKKTLDSLVNKKRYYHGVCEKEK